MKLTYLELAKQGKVVNVKYIPCMFDKNLNTMEWSMDDEYDSYKSYNIGLDLNDNEFVVEVFQFDDLSEDWISIEIIDGIKAEQMARNLKIIL